MSGSAAQLPCSLHSAVKGDRVRLVLWFKAAEEKPIYTLDARGEDYLLRERGLIKHLYDI